MDKRVLVEGLAASAGLARGKAKLFFSGDNAGAFPEGAVLVTTITDPTMVVAMLKAAAIVSDIGGLTSHPAILSREMGIPCVVNTKQATTLIEDGATIEVNGTTGEVYGLD